MATPDMAWERGDGKTNYELKDGDRVALRYDTINSSGNPVEANALGKVVKARTPKVTQKPGTSPYFANVDLDNGERVRVPHGALMKIRHLSPH